jgi:Frataxin-like domain
MGGEELELSIVRRPRSDVNPDEEVIGADIFAGVLSSHDLVMVLPRRLFYSLRRPLPLFPRPRPFLSNIRFYSASLEPPEYHRLADDTMDKLTSELETLLEENDLSGSDIEYSVLIPIPQLSGLIRIEWSINAQIGETWDVRDQQATSKSANLAQ